MDIDKIIEFLKEVDKLKQVKRATLNYNEKVNENSAEHSWHLALSTIVFSSFSNNNIDVSKCIKMAIIHDIVEVDAGDQIIYNEDRTKFDRELNAAKRIFGILPDNMGKELLDLWIEFEKKESNEAQFVGSLDRFLPLLSNVLNDGYSWTKFGISSEQVYKKNQPSISKGSEDIWKKANLLLQSSIEKGDLG